MWQPAGNIPGNLRDVRQLIDRLNAAGSPEAACFEADRPITLTRAPGRLDVMGGIADYSGSLVLEMPIAEAACCALQASDEPTLRITSLGADGQGRDASFAIGMGELATLDYDQARARLAENPQQQWAAYIAGALVVLDHERQVRVERGLRILIDSAVPEGKGVSSSAAIEVATMQAIAAALDIPLAARELAMLCQVVENRVVGAPCGVMDQMTSVCGRRDQLMRLRCQPAELEGHVRVPEGLSIWGIDSGIRHAVTGADYGSVRVGAFMGRKMIFDMTGEQTFGGYLANITPEQLHEQFIGHLPERMSGRAFLTAHAGHDDPVTRIEPDRQYAVATPTRHPVEENARVERFAALLEQPVTENTLRELGALMYASHASYSACGLGSDGTDELVEMVREAGPDAGLYGAKITGGGSGGTVAILGRTHAAPKVHDIAERYHQRAGREPYVFRGSTPGAAAFGSLRLAPS